MSKTDFICQFGTTLCFWFNRENGYCYPEISLDGLEGTSARLDGQHMTSDNIRELAAKLIQYANRLDHSK